jgi:hypothetical protein
MVGSAATTEGPYGSPQVRPLRPYVMADDPPPPPLPAAPEPAPEPEPPAPAPEEVSTRSSLAVRPFLLTTGRVAGAAELPLETQVVATSDGLAALPALTFEQHAIVAACRVPLSLAELAARLRLHLNVVRVIAGDLRTARHLAVYVPQASTAQDVSVLRRVIDGLRAVPDSRGLPRDSDRPA